jgi:hypothetical protein
MSINASINLYMADYGVHIIRKITKTTNIITTVAGNGMQGFSGDSGDATNAKLNQPHDVVADSIGFFLLFFK